MEDKSVKAGRNNTNLSTQKYLPFWEIRDGFILLKDWSLRAVLQVSSINFNLKSENEQKSLIAWYQWFLNTLNFPIQILIRSKRLDIDEYVEWLEKMAENKTNNLMKVQVLEYADYIKKLVEYANIMEKQFYVVVPLDWISYDKTGLFDFISSVFKSWEDDASSLRIRSQSFEKSKASIKSRVDSVVVWLNNIWLSTKQLDTVELVELFYEMYNPEVSYNEKMWDLKKENIENI